MGIITQERAKSSVFLLLSTVILLLVLFSALAIASFPLKMQSSSRIVLQGPAGTALAPLHLAGKQEVIYEEQDGIYAVPSSGGRPRALFTPGYIYNRAVPAQLKPTGELLYSGNGIWQANIFTGQAMKIASLPANGVITSLVLSSDWSLLAWSSAPADGKGTLTLYAGPPAATVPVYQRAADRCPCFRIFASLPATGKAAHPTLLLTDDHGDHEAVQHGLWTLPLNSAADTKPRQLFASDPPQGPLALSPATHALLYATTEEYVPTPDSAVPGDISGLSYANDLAIATLTGEPAHLVSPTGILPEQPQLSDSPTKRWVTTPLFSPDGRTLAYVAFSSDVTRPFERHSTLYSVGVNSTGSQIHVDQPQLLALAQAHYVELGGWLDGRTLLIYADNALYALDIQHGALATIVQTGTYARVVAVVQRGQS